MRGCTFAPLAALAGPGALGPFARDANLLVAPVLLFVYYLIVWLRLGRNSNNESVAVQYQPPEGLSPGAVRYITTTGSDGRTLAAVIAQLATRGCMAIEPQDQKYKLTRLDAAMAEAKALVPPLAPEESRLLAVLFEDGPMIVLDPKNSGELNRFLGSIYEELQKRLSNIYFTRHAGYVALGGLASFVTAIGMAITAQGRNADTFTLVFLTCWFFFSGIFLGLIVVMNLIPAWSRLLRGLGGIKEVLIGTGAVSAFAAGGAAVLREMIRNVSPTYAVALAALVLINLAWLPALKRLTPRGLEARNGIRGFRLFLEKVEQDRMQRLNAADQEAKSLEFLPYAIALEVREAWGDHLAEACFATSTQR
jgi:hypothetical protein